MWLEQFIIEKSVASKKAANRWKGLLRGGNRPLFDGKRLDSKRWGMNFRVPTFALVINTIRQFPDLR